MDHFLALLGCALTLVLNQKSNTMFKIWVFSSNLSVNIGKKKSSFCKMMIVAVIIIVNMDNNYYHMNLGEHQNT